MRENDTVESVVSKYPHLAQVFDAIAQYRKGWSIDASCPRCDHVISVVELPEIGVLETTCNCGLCRYREKTAGQ